jgi:hypothetical protein
MRWGSHKWVGLYRLHKRHSNTNLLSNVALQHNKLAGQTRDVWVGTLIDPKEKSLLCKTEELPLSQWRSLVSPHSERTTSHWVWCCWSCRDYLGTKWGDLQRALQKNAQTSPKYYKPKYYKNLDLRHTSKGAHPGRTESKAQTVIQRINAFIPGN